jgi:SAM-dependent methyltransferase
LQNVAFVLFAAAPAPPAVTASTVDRVSANAATNPKDLLVIAIPPKMNELAPDKPGSIERPNGNPTRTRCPVTSHRTHPAGSPGPDGALRGSRPLDRIRSVDDEMQQRATSFGEAAELYDRFRPDYPSEVLDAVAVSVPGARDVVEIGCGTGKATVGLARRGLSVIGVEPDGAMAAVARHNLAGSPNASVVVCPFEEWDGAPGSADIVAAAQSWSWVDRDVSIPIVRRVLRRPGVLAVFSNTPRPDETELRSELDAVYQRFAPSIAQTSGMTRWSTGPAGFERWQAQLATNGFDDIEVRRFDWTRRLSTDEHAALLETQSDHRVLPADVFDALRDGLSAVIDDHGGSFTFAYQAVLMLAHLSG